MASFITQLTNVTETDNIYPKTVAGAVYTGSAKTLRQSLNEIDTTLESKVDKTTNTNNCVMITNSSGEIIPDATMSTEQLHKLDNVTDNIQTQLDSKANTEDVADMSDNIADLYTIANGKQARINRWNYKITFSSGSSSSMYTPGLEINSAGQAILVNVFSDNILGDDGHVDPIPSNARILGVWIMASTGYAYGLSTKLHWSGDHAGDLYLTGVPTAKIISVFNDEQHSTVQSVRVCVTYAVEE